MVKRLAQGKWQSATFLTALKFHGAPRGGQGWTMLEWFLVNEEFGRVTNGLHWHVPNVYNVLASGSPEQIDRYLRPALRGEAGGDAYAVTEAEAARTVAPVPTRAMCEPSVRLVLETVYVAPVFR